MSEDDIKELKADVKEINKNVAILMTKEENREERCAVHQKTIDGLVDFKTRYETMRTAIITLILVSAALMAFLSNYTNYSKNTSVQAGTIKSEGK